MPTPQFSLPGGNDPAAMRDYIIKLQRDLQYLLTNLDDLNVSRLNARVIVSESITTDKLAADSITTDKLDANAVTADKIKAGAVTASKIDVEELSAISADLGHITAGLIEAIQIFGSYIATAQGTYPRAEMSSVDNLIRAATSANKKIEIVPSLSSPVTPALSFMDDDIGRAALMFLSNDGLNFLGASATNIIINTALGKVLMNWSNMQHLTSGRTLQQELDDKQNTIVGASGSFQSADAKTVTVTNGIVTGIV